MLVDDDPVINMVHSRLIERSCDYEVDVFENGRDALEKLSSQLKSHPPHLPDLILLDINMPVIDGWEFLVELRKLSPDGPETMKVIIVSSSIDSEDIEKSKTYPCVQNFISKPLTVARIKEIIAST